MQKWPQFFYFLFNIPPFLVRVVFQTPNGTLLQRIEGKVTHAKTNKLKFNFYHTIEQPTNLFVHDIKELVVLNDHNQMSVTEDIQEKLEIVPTQYAASSPGIILAAIGAIGQTVASIGKKIVKFFTNALYLLYTILVSIGCAVIVVVVYKTIRYFRNKNKHEMTRILFTNSQPETINLFAKNIHTQTEIISPTPPPPRRRYSVGLKDQSTILNLTSTN